MEHMDKERTVQKMFSSIAGYYDLNNTLLSFGLHYRWKRQLVKMAGICSGDFVLDIGAGTADLSILAAEKVGKTGKVIALDLNEPMLRIGRAKLARVSAALAVAAPPIECILANAESLPFKDQSVDVALTGFCMRNVANLDKAVGEIFRVLKPAGRFACLEFSMPQHKFLSKLYDFYSYKLLPAIGTYVAKDRTGVYQYLTDSIRLFPNQEAFSERIHKAGFKEVTYLNRTGGIVVIHIGKKDDTTP
ncbi:MAG: class I SAM-dependent methyltransferase [Nitrospirae bacterium]|nr:class I SAM-dependent methyltransferase [Candidatus Troglogloeales bacterium]